MRLLILSVGVLFTAYLGANCAIAQNGQWGQAGDQIAPYPTHVDRRHGHNHVYPDRGAVVRDVPKGATGVNYAGISYRFAGGVWYQRLGPAYIVVVPPVGLIVPNLPPFATTLDNAGRSFLYANDVYYRPRPDLGGYEVVNDPQDAMPQRSQAPAVASPARMASATPSAPRAATEPPVEAENRMAPRAAPPPPAAPPVAPSSDTPAPVNPTGVAISPRNGQDADQQAMDRYQCYRFAVGQTGFDPLASNGKASPDDVARGDASYSRAQAACLVSRGYSLP